MPTDCVWPPGGKLWRCPSCRFGRRSTYAQQLNSEGDQGWMKSSFAAMQQGNIEEYNAPERAADHYDWGGPVGEYRTRRRSDGRF
jgi:hypothetical protein